jgi:hypothetical protein
MIVSIVNKELAHLFILFLIEARIRVLPEEAER